MWKQLLPLVYLFLGYAVLSKNEIFKTLLSKFLTLALIPLVIILNLSHDFSHSILTISLFFCVVLAIFIYGKLVEKNPFNALYYAYLNIGWLGIPLSTAILTSSQTAILLNAYIGSSIFGNTVGVYALLQGNYSFNLGKLLRQPPIIAVFIGFIVSVLPIDFYVMVKRVEPILHMLLSFCGMAVLGIWLKSSRLNSQAFIKAFKIQLLKFIGFLPLAGILYLLLTLLGTPITYDITIVIAFICLLPPAANIVVLETYYLKKGDSATIITAGTLLSLMLLLIAIVIKTQI